MKKVAKVLPRKSIQRFLCLSSVVHESNLGARRIQLWEDPTQVASLDTRCVVVFPTATDSKLEELGLDSLLSCHLHMVSRHKRRFGDDFSYQNVHHGYKTQMQLLKASHSWSFSVHDRVMFEFAAPTS